ncbi:MAG: SDR family oxidoreductase [Sphaerochaetaceae bacterium]|jgi:NAD(P)-dependent dehydrogenase (short-subunit alcohol dehydrogenase family)|nr:SDR family oxidoreductase [Sphaerochaetaceae bacterium]NLO61639.1 SDR family oxidoreductase [Spirochaetales bacterium]MDD2405065.1 SDR family oxidoreductase [Sphaerochaetaceae bacterium]MDD3669705.1 SDR family oxidoreductase [Sphaerochaetaceae bacterium]MDD4258616.1 SDR family oxidoreductase [Sphaerochaetaceae bacterium]
MDMRLVGKKALVTGGSVGIGLAVSRELAKEGMDVAIFARNGERAKTEAERIHHEFGVNSYGISCDVTKPQDIEQAMKEVLATIGTVDVLVNNAGTGSEETIMEATDEKWQYYWDLHVMAAIRLSRACIPLMKKQHGGVIIQTASICAKQPLYYEPIYNTTKAALVMFGKCLSHEVIGDGIRVVTVSPGLVLTPDWYKTAGILSQKEGITAEAYLDRLAKEFAPIGRFATPEEVAKFYAFIASPNASYSVGSNYSIDGGWLRVID